MRITEAERKQLNNDGFSLIEVLLCIAIIAIVFLAIMNGFSLSARLNRDAHEMQVVTAFAQNLTEECKNADDVEAVLTGYSGVVEEPVTDSSAYGALTEEQKKLCTEEMFTVSTYKMRDVSVAGGGKYDVEIITNPLPYSEFVTDKTANPKVQDANTFGTPNVNQIEDANNPVIKDEIYRYDDAAVEELQALLPTGVKDGSDAQKTALRGAMQKEVTVTVQDNGADMLTVSAKAVYRSAYNGNAVEKEYLLYQASYKIEKQTKTIIDPDTNAPREVFEKYTKGGNVFIFADAMNGIAGNTITIVNKSRLSEPVTVSLIRGGGLNEANFNKVILSDGSAATVYADTADAGVNPKGIAAIYGMTFYSNIKGVQADTLRQQDLDATLHDTSAVYRCYDITVNIYEPGTNKVVASITSTKVR